MPNIYTRDRSSVLWVRYTNLDGKSVRQSAGTTDPVEAQAFLDKITGGAITYRRAVEHFFKMKERILKPTTLRGYRFSVRALDGTFGDKFLADIVVDDLKRYVAHRREEVTDASVKRDLAFLSSVITTAQETLIGAPDVNMVRVFSKRHLKEARRQVWLTKAEFNRLEGACFEEVHRLILRTAVETGLRHGELLTLRRDWIDWDEGYIQVSAAETKTNQYRMVPLRQPLLGDLKDFCSRHTGNSVFVQGPKDKPFTSFQGFFDNARTRARLKNLRFHDLRHTFASWYVQNGGDIMQLKSVLGHASIQSVMGYAHMHTKHTGGDIHPRH